MEYKKITVVDEEDAVIGFVSYDEAIEKEMIRRASVVFLFDEQGNLLVQKRSAHISKPLQLDKSVGGHVDEGETYLETAVREMEEELGLSAILLTEVMLSYRSTTESFFDGVFKGVISRSTPINFDPHEVDSVYWMSIDELEAKMQNEPELFNRGFISMWKDLRDKILSA